MSKPSPLPVLPPTLLGAADDHEAEVPAVLLEQYKVGRSALAVTAKSGEDDSICSIFGKAVAFFEEKPQ